MNFFAKVKNLTNYTLAKTLSRRLYTKYLKRKIKLQKDEVAILCPHHSGEIYLICSMIDSFKTKHNIDKIILIGSKKYHQQIYEMFAHKIDRYYFVEKEYIKCLKYHLSVKKGNFFLSTDGLWSTLIEYGIPHFDVLKICADIGKNSKLSHPLIKEEYQISAKDKFNKLSLKEDKTVLISPEAISAQSLPISFWQKISEQLKVKGYDVFLNIMDDKNAIKDVKTEYLNFSEAFIFTQMCGHVIALRSGFCEVISGANANFHIIYNNLSHKTYGMKPIIKKNLMEYVFKKQSLDDLMNNILKSF